MSDTHGHPRELAVTAFGADQPGIIARVTGVLAAQGGNLEDSAMTILGGHFAIMLLVTARAEPAELERALVDATADLGLVVTVRPVGPGTHSPPPTHVLSVYATDRPGLVHEVSTVLSDAGINVTDLTTRVIEGERTVYAMMFEVALDDDTDAQALEQRVRDRVAGAEATLSALEVGTF